MNTTHAVCKGCGEPLPPPRPGRRHGRPRAWCNNNCRRRTVYAGTCGICGGPTAYSGTSTPSPVCSACSHRREREQATWTRDAIIDAAHRWRRLVGDWPTATDWHRAAWRSAEHRAAWQAFTAATGPWPPLAAVYRRFASWQELMDAVGGRSRGRAAGKAIGEPARKIAALKRATP